MHWEVTIMAKTKYSEIPDEYFVSYFNFLIGRVWKILPMWEENNEDLKSYMESLQRELIGNINLVKEIKCDSYFITLLSKLEYLINEEYTHEICRKEVFECVDIVKKIAERYGVTKEV